MITILRHSDHLTTFVVAAVAALMKLHNEQIVLEFKNDPIDIPKIPSKRGRKGPTVNYVAIGGPEALELLEGKTVQGLVYKHLLDHGPCTEKHIRETTTWGRKALESAIDKLKSKGIVVAVPITPVPAALPQALPAVPEQPAQPVDNVINNDGGVR